MTMTPLSKRSKRRVALLVDGLEERFAQGPAARPVAGLSTPPTVLTLLTPLRHMEGHLTVVLLHMSALLRLPSMATRQPRIAQVVTRSQVPRTSRSQELPMDYLPLPSRANDLRQLVLTQHLQSTPQTSTDSTVLRRIPQVQPLLSVTVMAFTINLLHQ